jgi:hypothetical protein
MKKKLYLIQFKVEGISGPKEGAEGNDGDYNDNEDMNGENKGLDDLDQEITPEQKNPPGSSKGNKGSTLASPFSIPASNKRVLD